jgi:hypothetical protein
MWRLLKVYSRRGQGDDLLNNNLLCLYGCTKPDMLKLLVIDSDTKEKKTISIRLPNIYDACVEWFDPCNAIRTLSEEIAFKAYDYINMTVNKELSINASEIDGVSKTCLFAIADVYDDTRLYKAHMAVLNKYTQYSTWLDKYSPVIDSYIEDCGNFLYNCNFDEWTKKLTRHDMKLMTLAQIILENPEGVVEWVTTNGQQEFFGEVADERRHGRFALTDTSKKIADMKNCYGFTGIEKPSHTDEILLLHSRYQDYRYWIKGTFEDLRFLLQFVNDNIDNRGIIDYIINYTGNLRALVTILKDETFIEFVAFKSAKKQVV